MNNEFELISHPHIHSFNILLVRLYSRVAHAHNEIEVGLILDGTVTMTVSGTCHELNKGDMYILNPMDVHEFRSEGKEGALILALQVSKHLVTSSFQQTTNSYYIENSLHNCFADHETRYEIMKGLFIELACNYFGQYSNYEFKCMSILNMLLYILNTYVPKRLLNDAEFSTYLQTQQRLNRITEYIDEHFQQKLLLRDIAEVENLSLTYLSHFFQDNVGMSFQDYVGLKRLEYAYGLLLNTDKTVLTISIESGFSDVRYLNKLCQKYYGCSASELRTGEVAITNENESVSATMQNIFTPNDSLLLLRSLQETYRETYKDYSIWEFFK